MSIFANFKSSEDTTEKVTETYLRLFFFRDDARTKIGRLDAHTPMAKRKLLTAALRHKTKVLAIKQIELVERIREIHFL